MTRTLTIQDLVVEAQRPSGEWFGIVHNVDVKVKSGEVVALIGESGAGKTTVGLGALAYSRPGTRIVGGQVYLDDIDLLSMAQEERREVRGKQVAYVAQSAAAALNPAIRLGEQVTESLLVYCQSISASSQRRPAAAGDDGHGDGLFAGFHRI
jgi:peptide/nickel transport system ATP-binding protein